MSCNKIRVCVRFRPLSEKEKSQQEEIASVYEVIDRQSCSVGPHSFSFDHVFTPNDTQQDLFTHHFNEYVDNVLDGYNSCIIAYGQTAAGKSYTMTGGEQPEHEGAIPRSIRRIFANQKGPIKATYVEIHNERLKDLFNNGATVTMLGDGSLRDAYTVTASSAFEALKAVKWGNRSRSIASTKMNDSSSRSHALLTLTMETGATLMLVDLAGSETVKKTGSSGTTLEEAGNINKSLTTLAIVVSSLVKQTSRQQQQQQHIPFRGSKLTQVLQLALGGDSKTSVIINCSPSPTHVAETISSLRFGTRCKEVKTKVPPKSERLNNARLLMKKAEMAEALLPWKLGQAIDISEWLDLQEIHDLLQNTTSTEEDPWSGYVSDPSLKNTSDVAVESISQAKRIELAELDECISKINKDIRHCQTEIENLKSHAKTFYTDDANEEQIFAYIEEQAEKINELQLLIIEQDYRNDKLRQDLTLARSRPNSEKVRMYLQSLYLQMEDIASKIRPLPHGSKRSHGNQVELPETKFAKLT